MELSYRLYRIATYGPGLSWRWRLNNRSAARLWRMQKVNFWLEGVNGRPRRPSGDVLNKPPWADRNVLECRTATAVERQLRSGSSGSSRPTADINGFGTGRPIAAAPNTPDRLHCAANFE